MYISRHAVIQPMDSVWNDAVLDTSEENMLHAQIKISTTYVYKQKNACPILGPGTVPNLA